MTRHHLRNEMDSISEEFGLVVWVVPEPGDLRGAGGLALRSHIADDRSSMLQASAAPRSGGWAARKDRALTAQIVSGCSGCLVAHSASE